MFPVFDCDVSVDDDVGVDDDVYRTWGEIGVGSGAGEPRHGEGGAGIEGASAGSPPERPVKEVFGRLLAAMEEVLKLGSGEGGGVLQGRQDVFTRQLRGLEWEVVVVKDDRNITWSEPGGKIVVFTGFLDAAQSEVELATIIGHEMGLVVEALAAACFANPLFPLLAKFDVAARVYRYLHKRRPFSPRRGKEADVIGLFLSSSAGYDPEVSLDFYRKWKLSEGIWKKLTPTLPSGTARAKTLSQPKVMKEAIARFEAAKNRHMK